MPKNTIQADALLILWAKATVPDCVWALFGWTILNTGSYWTLMVLIGHQWAFAFEDGLAD